MKIQTKYLGEIEIAEEDFIQFKNGLPGFPDEKDFIILDFPGNNAFQLLQSVKTTNLAFVITNPYLFYQDYTLKLDDAIIEGLHIKKPEDVVVYTIVTVRQPFEESTMNLRAPVIIQPIARLGKQYILNDSDYSSQAFINPQQKGVK